MVQLQRTPIALLVAILTAMLLVATAPTCLASTANVNATQVKQKCYSLLRGILDPEFCKMLIEDAMKIPEIRRAIEGSIVYDGNGHGLVWKIGEPICEVPVRIPPNASFWRMNCSRDLVVAFNKGNPGVVEATIAITGKYGQLHHELYYEVTFQRLIPAREFHKLPPSLKELILENYYTIRVDVPREVLEKASFREMVNLTRRKLTRDQALRRIEDLAKRGWYICLCAAAYYNTTTLKLEFYDIGASDYWIALPAPKNFKPNVTTTSASTRSFRWGSQQVIAVAMLDTRLTLAVLACSVVALALYLVYRHYRYQQEALHLQVIPYKHRIC